MNKALKNKFIKIGMIVLLAFVLAFVTTVVYQHAFAKSNKSVVIACSDFQQVDTKAGRAETYSKGNSLIAPILKNIAGTYSNADGFICGGDYCKDHTDDSKSNTDVGITQLYNTVSSYFHNIKNWIFVQGNHDADSSKISEYGAHEFENYSVFVLNEDKFSEKSESTSHHGMSPEKASKCAADLNTYLSNKNAINYAKPIFITSHVPLHYSGRTYDNSDGIYASKVFETINNNSTNLNVFFLYGHNHHEGYDDYLGGNAQFLTKGDSQNAADSILIAKFGQKDQYTSEKLNFTYMNYGYVGYYYTKNKVDATLNMSTFEIDGNNVKVTRWDENGVHEYLKSPGVDYKPSSHFSRNNKPSIAANLKVYKSSYVVEGPAASVAVNTEQTIDTPDTSNPAGTIPENSINTENNVDPDFKIYDHEPDENYVPPTPEFNYEINDSDNDVVVSDNSEQENPAVNDPEDDSDVKPAIGDSGNDSDDELDNESDDDDSDDDSDNPFHNISDFFEGFFGHHKHHHDKTHDKHKSHEVKEKDAPKAHKGPAHNAKHAKEGPAHDANHTKGGPAEKHGSHHSHESDNNQMWNGLNWFVDKLMPKNIFRF